MLGTKRNFSKYFTNSYKPIINNISYSLVKSIVYFIGKVNN